jgi:S-adenosylmethionine synthetase
MQTKFWIHIKLSKPPYKRFGNVLATNGDQIFLAGGCRSS